MSRETKIKHVGVFCGSCSGNVPIYEEAAYELGKTLALEHINLIYGGGGIGLMRTVADAVLQHGGSVTGILPRFFDSNAVGHKTITEMIIVNSMSERKEKIIALSDAFIALPGGYGTLDELFEVLVYSQLNLHRKAVGILNTNHFYDPLLQQLARMQEDGFL
ncbi:MAG: TIGR00730 family Rossman fold protein, partial [Bacteroidales bacterium]|nr:TIGR00730 family Rossman fold protein [Bacteroidales bacterium]